MLTGQLSSTSWHGTDLLRYLRGLLRRRSRIRGHGRLRSSGVLPVCEVKGRTQEGFDSEPDSGVAPLGGEPPEVLNMHRESQR